MNVMRIFVLIWGIIVFFLGCLFVILPPYVIVCIPIGLFAIRHSLRMADIAVFDKRNIKIKTLLSKKTICFDDIKCAKIAQNNVYNLDQKDVYIFLDGIMNYYYIFSTKEKNIASEMHRNSIPVKSLFFNSEIQK